MSQCSNTVERERAVDHQRNDGFAFVYDLDPSVIYDRGVNETRDKGSGRGITNLLSPEEQSGNPAHEGLKETSDCRVRKDGEPKKGKRKKNWIKANRAEFNYVLGEDIRWEQVSQLASRTLVGRAMGRHFVLKTVVAWAEENWKEDLGYVLEVVLLTKGWFDFNFLLPKHI